MKTIYSIDEISDLERRLQKAADVADSMYQLAKAEYDEHVSRQESRHWIIKFFSDAEGYFDYSILDNMIERRRDLRGINKLIAAVGFALNTNATHVELTDSERELIREYSN